MKALTKHTFSVLILVHIIHPTVQSIGCFTCTSQNHSDTGCEDPFNSANSVYTKPCLQGIQGRKGLFPANYCIKVKGTKVTDNEQLTIRTCSVTSMSQQCGVFKFEGVYMHGCIKTCDYDGCNAAGQLQSHYYSTSLSLLAACLVARTWMSS